jgi:methylated-DNA-[protein]-cysteine S-methyltransferase
MEFIRQVQPFFATRDRENEMNRSISSIQSWFYWLCQSPFGPLGLLWQDPESPRIWRVFLPESNATALIKLLSYYPSAQKYSVPEILQLAADFHRFFSSEQGSFARDSLPWHICSPFQRQVLEAEAAVLRSLVTTYGLLATHLEKPGAAQAVGQALANNPFPILIPCHRTVGSDGTLGGYQGGASMKRVLLEMEGVPFDAAGHVRPQHWFYDDTIGMKT